MWWGRGGRGLGPNPYPFCRFFPWLPRLWWLFPYFSYFRPYPYYLMSRYPFYTYPFYYMYPYTF
ncbi:MAG: hypothetical protein ACTSYT_00565 [Candidatus Asgardarchaeia archaeon]